jgi:hypothetical protein
VSAGPLPLTVGVVTLPQAAAAVDGALPVAAVVAAAGGLDAASDEAPGLLPQAAANSSTAEPAAARRTRVARCMIGHRPVVNSRREQSRNLTYHQLRLTKLAPRGSSGTLPDGY